MFKSSTRCLPHTGPNVHEDVSAVKNGEQSHLRTSVPLDAIRLSVPPDGLPCITDYIATTISFIFNGSRLHREPLDLDVRGGQDQFSIKKGFTRLTLSFADSFCCKICFQLCLIGSRDLQCSKDFSFAGPSHCSRPGPNCCQGHQPQSLKELFVLRQKQ